ncbi:MAG: quinone oxidoreductase [Nitriliruptorales bacterium]|nr:quinone oxidoreductase [Nitriliruptorales bacterium]
MRAVQVQEPGGPEVLEVHEVADPEPDTGEVLVEVAAAGINFIDVYHRTGTYDRDLPFVPGLEGAGTVRAVGDEVSGVSDGDRVAWGQHAGSYAEQVAVPADAVIRLPDDVSDEVGAAMMLQGMTAHYLATSTFRLDAQSTALVYAAAGGVGHLLTQIARREGARVIATASTEEKAELARNDGADDVILYRDEDVVERVRELTGGRGVDVVYDSVGADTFTDSLDCLRPRGVLVLYGQSSGAVEPLDPQVLNRKGSLFLTRPSLGHYVANRSEFEDRANDLLTWIGAGQLDVRIDRTFPLAEAAEAHRHIESGSTRGKVLLIP